MASIPINVDIEVNSHTLLNEELQEELQNAQRAVLDILSHDDVTFEPNEGVVHWGDQTFNVTDIDDDEEVEAYNTSWDTEEEASESNSVSMTVSGLTLTGGAQMIVTDLEGNVISLDAPDLAPDLTEKNRFKSLVEAVEWQV